ncbi:MAG: leucine-rich repeat domain-containing protein [Clostridia bacterium]|nr:leucine-rich repeat domain-containing protein [Clostridia bacterium]
MKKALPLSFVLLLLVLLLSLHVGAASATDGRIGSCTWRVEDGVLTISGNGSMGDSTTQPWGKNITAIIIEEGVTDICPSAFEGCTKLTSVSLPSSMRRIGAGAFINCTALPGITLPEGVVSIGNGAFEECHSLLEIRIPKSVSSIGTYAFSGCYSLVSILVDEENRAFCSVDGVLYNKSMTKLMKYPPKKTGYSYTLPSTVTSIDIEALAYSRNLREVILHDHVTSIGIQAFSATYMAANTGFWEKGVIYVGNYAVGAVNKTAKEVTIREGTLLIADGIFAGADLQKLYLPEGLTTIGTNVFSWCKKLTTVFLPSSLKRVGESAFYDCTALDTVCYRGLEEDIENIFFGKQNEKLIEAEWLYDTCTRSMDHDLTPLTDKRPPTCGLEGLREQSCRTCGAVYYAVIPTVPHDFSISSQSKAPTCIAAGILETICSLCGKTETSTVPPTDHVYGRWMEESAPTCTEVGVKRRVCALCQGVDAQHIAPAGHTFGEYAVTVKPTFRKEGLKEALCAACGARDSAPVPILGASAVLLPLGIAAAVLAIVAVCLTAAPAAKNDDDGTVIL